MPKGSDLVSASGNFIFGDDNYIAASGKFIFAFGIFEKVIAKK